MGGFIYMKMRYDMGCLLNEHDKVAARIRPLHVALYIAGESTEELRAG